MGFFVMYIAWQRRRSIDFMSFFFHCWLLIFYPMRGGLVGINSCTSFAQRSAWTLRCAFLRVYLSMTSWFFMGKGVVEWEVGRKEQCTAVAVTVATAALICDGYDNWRWVWHAAVGVRRHMTKCDREWPQRKRAALPPLCLAPASAGEEEKGGGTNGALENWGVFKMAWMVFQ